MPKFVSAFFNWSAKLTTPGGFAIFHSREYDCSEDAIAELIERVDGRRPMPFTINVDCDGKYVRSVYLLSGTHEIVRGGGPKDHPENEESEDVQKLHKRDWLHKEANLALDALKLPEK